LRQCLGGLGVTVLGNQVALIHADKAFDDAGALREEHDAKSVQRLAAELVKAASALS
jgi:hypothetical protein